MKYQNLLAFEKYLAQAAKAPLPRVFLVVSACAYERRRIIEKILEVICAREGEIGLQMQEDVEACIQALNTTSLFAGSQVFYFDEVDKLKKNGLGLLASYIDKPSPFSYLLLGATSSKSLSDIEKKELVVCDLGSEKPWEHKDRLKRALVDQASKAGKRLSGEALEYLLENVGLTLAGLENALEKLILFAGTRGELSLQDARALCPAEKGPTLWQLVDAIAWKDPFPKLEEEVDLALLFPLVSQLRTQFQQGFALALLVERGAASKEIAHFLPSVKPAALDKMLPCARTRGSSFFKRALNLLFSMELLLKNSGSDPALILDCFLIKLSLLKRHHHAVPTS